MCAPDRPTADWYYRLSKVSDATEKQPAGNLVRVAADAPTSTDKRSPTYSSRVPSRPRVVARVRRMPADMRGRRIIER